MKKFYLLGLGLLCSLAAWAQEWGVVNLSVCNLRRTPEYSAEMVSQALLGTPVRILQRNASNNWPEVQTPDGYTGWVHREGITALDEEAFQAWKSSPKVVVTALTALVYADASTRSATVSDAVAGDRLLLLGKKRHFWKVGFPDGREGYLSRQCGQEEHAWRASLDRRPEAILSTARSMLGFPYIWAGMSPKGMDCSGFVRTVLYMHDIIIPRDSGPQSRVGRRISSPEELLPGDLVFFGRWKEDGTPSVGHVGFYLGEGRFIHSLGIVKIGSFSPADPLYDAYNTGRYLFGGRILPYVDQDPAIQTLPNNPYYAE